MKRISKDKRREYKHVFCTGCSSEEPIHTAQYYLFINSKRTIAVCADYIERNKIDTKNIRVRKIT